MLYSKRVDFGSPSWGLHSPPTHTPCFKLLVRAASACGDANSLHLGPATELYQDPMSLLEVGPLTVSFRLHLLKFYILHQ